MNRSSEIGGAGADWIARPKPARFEPWNLRRLARRGLDRVIAVSAIINPDTLGKGWHRVRRGEWRLLLSSARNLIAQHLTLLDGASPWLDAEVFDPQRARSGTPLVAIVIPCFNDGRFVREALDSALAQTFTNLEVIVVDGGSTDGATPAVIASLAGPRVCPLIRTDGRHYVGDNRNYGIEHTRSLYVCCLDSDDVLEPTYIEKVLFHLEYRAYDVGSSSMRMFGAKEGEWRLRPRPTLGDFRLGNQALTCSVFRRTLWENAGRFRDTGLGKDHVAEDWDLWVRMAALGARFRNNAQELLLNYRVREGGQSLSSHPDVPPSAEQALTIQNGNRAVLTRAAHKLSRVQAHRRFRPAHPDTAMRTHMRQAAEAARRPTLLLAMPYFSVGGAERLLAQVVGGLAAVGWRVVAISTEHEPPNGGDALPWFTAHTAECYAFPRFLAPEDWRDFLDYLLGSRRPDALVIAGSRFLYDLLPGLAAEYPAMARLDLLFNTEGHVEKHLQHRAQLTGALCESEPTRRWLREIARWPNAALRCIPNGVDTTLYSPGPRPAVLAAELGIGPGDIVVGWSGRLSEEKSPETFLELATRCSDLAHVHFVMMGGGRLAKRIDGLAARLPEGTRLHRCGMVDDTRTYYRLFDVCTLTSRLDGRPNAVLEAQASGCAVLAARVGGVPDIVAEGRTGLLANPADAADFERALRNLLADRARLAAMRVAAPRLMRDHFSVAATVDGYRRALEEAVAACRDG